MEVIEQALSAKNGRIDDCEDAIVVTPHYAAVIDGASDASGQRIADMTSGRHLATVLSELIRELPPGLDAQAAVAFLSSGIAARIAQDTDRRDRPEASVVIYSRAARQVWSVGDCGYWHAGLPQSRQAKAVDDAAASMRSAVLAAHLALGVDPEHLRATDPGRAAILPLLRTQRALANNGSPDVASFAYPVLNGLPVTTEMIRIHPVPPEVAELVLASDGFPVLHPTLAETRSTLAALARQDPLCINALCGTKPVRQESGTFDDTAYLRLHLGKHES